MEGKNKWCDQFENNAFSENRTRYAYWKRAWQK